MWQEFKESFSPELLSLSVQDNERRFLNFIANMKLIDARNEQEVFELSFLFMLLKIIFTTTIG